MEFLNHKIEIKNCSETNNTHIMKQLFESQSSGLGKIYEEINKNFSINKILEESQKSKREFLQSANDVIVIQRKSTI